MKKILFFTVLALTSGTVSLNAQQLSREYLDSVKSFYSEWSENQKDFVYTVMDNTAYPTDINFCLYRINFESLFYPPCVVYKLDEHKTLKRIINDVDEKKQYSSDSIMLTEDETNYAFARLQASTSFKWTNEIFPNAKIVDSEWYFTRWINTPAGMPKPAYWTVSLPVFLRNGEYCLMFYRYYCGPDCGYEALIVYKRENNRWEKFGTLSEREFKA